MAVSLFTNTRYRTPLLIAASVLIIAGAAVGTVLLIKQFAPAREPDTSNEVTTDNTPSVEKAEDLFANGDYAGAKAQYQGVLEEYKAQKNEVGVKDMEMQLKVVDATASAPAAPQNTDRGKVTVGSASEQ